MKRIRYEILTGTTGTTGVTISYQLPIFLEASVDEMGVMVGFDGDAQQINQFCNFTYSGSGNTIIVYNSINTNQLKTLVNSIFSISWGDGSSDTVYMPTVYNKYLPSVTHIYTGASGTYDIELTVTSSWGIEKLDKIIQIPFNEPGFPTDFGILTGITIPYTYYPPITGATQQYLEDYRTLTGSTKPATGVTIQFVAVGKSRIDEFQLYGSSGAYDWSITGLTTGSTSAGDYTGYTIDGLFYMDYADGYTHITGCTTGSTTINGIIYFTDEVLYQGMITRNEHLIGFLNQPQIYSDIFVDRGKQGVMERNLRLGEIDSTGALELYGGGYYDVKKQ